MRRFLGYPLRGAIGFGLAMLITVLPLEFTSSNLIGMLIAPFTGGAVGAIIFISGGDAEARCVLGFGAGFCVLWLVVLFAHISIQGGGQPDYGWGAIGTAAGFALGGGLGGLTMRPGLLFPGAIAFGLAGLIGGPISFYLVYHGIGAEMVMALPLIGALAGGLFGLAVELLGD